MSWYKLHFIVIYRREEYFVIIYLIIFIQIMEVI
nr:MAG TPA: hypothetical protein [Caudoviricetes sp.]